jgi:hypothetical protein
MLHFDTQFLTFQRVVVPEEKTELAIELNWKSQFLYLHNEELS